MIERNIRTLSTTATIGQSLLLHKSHSVEAAPSTTTTTAALLERLDLNDLRERWLTKKEKMMVEEEQEEHIENEEDDD